MEHYFEEDYHGEHWPLVRLVGFAARWARDYRTSDEAIDCTPLEALGIPVERARLVIEDFRAKQEEVKAMANVLSRG
jgi:hypothetical protein